MLLENMTGYMLLLLLDISTNGVNPLSCLTRCLSKVILKHLYKLQLHQSWCGNRFIACLHIWEFLSYIIILACA